MNCDDVSPLLPLFRAGELTPGERAALGAHLAACRSCSAEAAAYAALDGTLADARASRPQPADPEHLTRAILAAAGRASHAAPTRRSAWNVLLDFVARPAVRIGYALACVALVALALYQQFDTARRVAALEVRLSSDVPARAGREAATFRIPAEASASLRAGTLPAMVALFGGSIRGERIEVPRETAEKAADALRDDPRFLRLAAESGTGELRNVVLAIMYNDRPFPTGG